MTTIACNKKEMCCDLQFTYGGDVKVKGTTKIYKMSPHVKTYPEPYIIGFCGNTGDMIEVADFYERPDTYTKLPRVKNLSGLVLTESGSIYIFDTPSRWVLTDTLFAAMGSGATVALGALHMNASPEEAVAAASQVDPYTGMGTKTLSF